MIGLMVSGLLGYRAVPELTTARSGSLAKPETFSNAQSGFDQIGVPISEVVSFASWSVPKIYFEDHVQPRVGGFGHGWVGRRRMLQIAFETKSLRAVCEDETQARRQYEAGVVDALQKRLADLRAASTVQDVLIGNPRALDGAEEDCMEVDLEGSWRIVFAANHPKNPKTVSGECDWARVTRLRILRIEDRDA